MSQACQARRGLGQSHENVNMAAWRVLSMTRLIVLFLCFSNTLGIKVSIGGASHVCVSGSQVLHVNFGSGPIPQCGLVNTTPDGHANNEKAKEQGREAQSSTPTPGLYASENDLDLADFL